MCLSEEPSTSNSSRTAESDALASPGLDQAEGMWRVTMQKLMQGPDAGAEQEEVEGQSVDEDGDEDTRELEAEDDIRLEEDADSDVDGSRLEDAAG